MWRALLAANRRLLLLVLHVLWGPLLVHLRARRTYWHLLLRREGSWRSLVREAVAGWWAVAHPTVSWRRSVSHPAVAWYCAWSPREAMRTTWTLKARLLLELAWRRSWRVAAELLLVLIGRWRAAELLLLLLWRQRLSLLLLGWRGWSC